jgi:hypothetical protein
MLCPSEGSRRKGHGTARAGKPLVCDFCGKPNPQYRLQDAKGIFQGTRWACESCMIEQVFEKRNCKLRIDLFLNFEGYVEP